MPFGTKQPPALKFPECSFQHYTLAGNVLWVLFNQQMIAFRSIRADRRQRDSIVRGKKIYQPEEDCFFPPLTYGEEYNAHYLDTEQAMLDEKPERG